MGEYCPTTGRTARWCEDQTHVTCGPLAGIPPTCNECGDEIDSTDPHAGYGMCASCLHDALRSGWDPSGAR